MSSLVLNVRLRRGLHDRGVNGADLGDDQGVARVFARLVGTGKAGGELVGTATGGRNVHILVICGIVVT